MGGVMTIYLPVWSLIVIGGGALWYMNNRWFAVGAWVVAAVIAGFVSHPYLTAGLNAVKGLV